MPSPSLMRKAICGLTAVVVLCAACSSNGHREAQTTTSSTAAPPPTSTTEPAPVYSPSPFLWQRASSRALASGGGPTASLAALLAPELSEPWTLAGTRVSADGTPAATVWTSPDGRTWTAAALNPAGPAQADAASQYHGEVVIAGAVGEGANEQAAVWSEAAPGRPFTEDPVPVSDGPSVMNLVTQGSLGLFATGTVDGRFAMWSSTNGSHWGEQPSAEKVISSLPGARVNALMAEGDFVYAAGSIETASGPEAAVWSSADGLHWRLVNTAPSSFSGPGSRVIYSLAPLGSGLVAVGAVNRGTGWQPASWISPDGVSWSRPSTAFPGVPALPPGGVGSAGLAVSAIMTFAGSTSVVASTGGPGGERAWKSADGLHWTAITLPAAATASTAWRPGLIAGTTSTTVLADGDPGQPHVLTDETSGWSEPSSNPSVFGAVQPVSTPIRMVSGINGLALEVSVTSSPQAVGPASSTAEVISSSDGVNWQPDSPARLQQPSSLPAAGATAARLPGDGWVAVGESAGGYPESWTSPGGVAWTSAGALDPISPATGTHPSAEVTGLCPSGATSSGGAAAVGTAITAAGSGTFSRSAAAWWTGTGSSWRRAAITPGPSAGVAETIVGCLHTATGLVAYGTSAGAGGAPAPALWRSTTGISWARQPVAAFAANTPNPISDLATYGPEWLAVANPAAAPASGPPGPHPTTENGMDGLWLSNNSGQSWERVDVSGAPWRGTFETELALTGYAGATPVVVGTVDGRLAVWTGSPAPARATTSSSP